jgi:hypothetical protein
MPQNRIKAIVVYGEEKGDEGDEQYHQDIGGIDFAKSFFEKGDITKGFFQMGQVEAETRGKDESVNPGASEIDPFGDEYGQRNVLKKMKNDDGEHGIAL